VSAPEPVWPAGVGAGVRRRRRALLRGGVRFLAGCGFGRVALMVDGAIDGALALYRSEGFEVARTHELWGFGQSRVPSPPSFRGRAHA
jgi:hypothetical protein